MACDWVTQSIGPLFPISVRGATIFGGNSQPFSICVCYICLLFPLCYYRLVCILFRPFICPKNKWLEMLLQHLFLVQSVVFLSLFLSLSLSFSRLFCSFWFLRGQTNYGREGDGSILHSTNKWPRQIQARNCEQMEITYSYAGYYFVTYFSDAVLLDMTEIGVQIGAFLCCVLSVFSSSPGDGMTKAGSWKSGRPVDNSNVILGRRTKGVWDPVYLVLWR